MLLVREIGNCSLVLTYTRVSTGCQCNYELTLNTWFWLKAKRGPYFSSYFKISPVLIFICFLQQIKIIIMIMIIIILILIIIIYWKFCVLFYFVIHPSVHDCSFSWNRSWWLRDISHITPVKIPSYQWDIWKRAQVFFKRV